MVQEISIKWSLLKINASIAQSIMDFEVCL